MQGRHPGVLVDCDGSLHGGQLFVITSRGVEQQAAPRVQLGVAGLHRQRLVQDAEGRGDPAFGLKHPHQPEQIAPRCCAQRSGAPKVDLGAGRIVIESEAHLAHGEMGVGERAVGSEGALGFGSRQAQLRTIAAIEDRARSAGARQRGPRRGELRIERHAGLVALNRSRQLRQAVSGDRLAFAIRDAGRPARRRRALPHRCARNQAQRAGRHEQRRSGHEQRGEDRRPPPRRDACGRHAHGWRRLEGVATAASLMRLGRAMHGSDEAVAVPVKRLDETRTVGIVLQRDAQLTHRRVQARLEIDVDGVRPQDAAEPIAADDIAVRRYQGDEQPEGLRGQPDQPSLSSQLARVGVELVDAKADDGRQLGDFRLQATRRQDVARSAEDHLTATGRRDQAVPC